MKPQLMLWLGTAASHGRYFFLQMSYVLIGGLYTGVIFRLKGGTPVKTGLGVSLSVAHAAIMGFLRRVGAGSDAAGLSYVLPVAAAAAALLSWAGRPSGREKMTLAPTSAPNVGCCLRVPAISRTSSAYRNW